MTPRTILAISLVLLAGCADPGARTVVKTQASDDLRCDESKLQIVQVDETSDGGTLHARNGTMMTPRAYRASGCGKQHTYICDDWNSYEQKPVCHGE